VPGNRHDVSAGAGRKWRRGGPVLPVRATTARAAVATDAVAVGRPEQDRGVGDIRDLPAQDRPVVLNPRGAHGR
jgi:hypothetical protein